MGELDKLLISETNEHEKKIKRTVFVSRTKDFLSNVLKICLLAAVFFATLDYIGNKASISEQNLRNVALENEVHDLQSRIAELNVAISSQFSLEHISEYAANELGMIYPTAARVVSLDSSGYVAIASPSSVYRSVVGGEIAIKTRSKE